MKLPQILTRSPTGARIIPFLIFALLTLLQGQLGADSRFWLYAVKTIVGAWMLWSVRSVVTEMSWSFSWEAVIGGVAVFGLWVGLDGLYPQFSFNGEPWNPIAHYTGLSSLGWLYVGVRLLGSTLVVPPLEEVFYRSFLYRYMARPDFLSVPLGRFLWKPFLTTAAVFGLAHFEWLPGILTALIYQGLVCRKRRLGDAMTAHAITNLLLGIWVIWRGDWKFW